MLCASTDAALCHHSRIAKSFTSITIEVVYSRRHLLLSPLSGQLLLKPTLGAVIIKPTLGAVIIKATLGAVK